ncbi:hypothetical protein THRCLA_10515 [Thraustotheca clavata]|uniref:Calcineurin-like phosphoesterase domain-containing protein n=1 Tax=Thraustotheca clavata TaxID=74557 RepID=A0A1V9YM27_9STRA|nr:hypothetical protein THRCLA_10515 [Thraustotheca clavata]
MIQRKQGLGWSDVDFDTQDITLLPTLDTPKTKKPYYQQWYLCWNIHVPLLLGAWLLLFTLGELGASRYAVHSCSWANIDQHEHRLVVIADPQLTDYYSYGMARGSWTLALTEFYSDLFMRRNFQQITRMHTPPDSVLVLGDIFDGGRILDAEAHTKHRDRFNWIFDTGRQSIQFYNMTGNHDVGIREWYSDEAAKKFQEQFGPSQYTVVLGHVELVVIDTIAMLSSNSTVRDAALEFVKTYGSMKSKHNYPRLLFTHIPLYRPNQGATCGPSRHSPIKQGQGVSYQNVIPKQTTDFILAMIEPAHVFRCIFLVLDALCEKSE